MSVSSRAGPPVSGSDGMTAPSLAPTNDPPASVGAGIGSRVHPDPDEHDRKVCTSSTSLHMSPHPCTGQALGTRSQTPRVEPIDEPVGNSLHPSPRWLEKLLPLLKHTERKCLPFHGQQLARNRLGRKSNSNRYLRLRGANACHRLGGPHTPSGIVSGAEETATGGVWQ
jgi:hypothetical protein